MIYLFPCSVGTSLLLNHLELVPVKELPQGSNLKTLFLRTQIFEKYSKIKLDSCALTIIQNQHFKINILKEH